MEKEQEKVQSGKGKFIAFEGIDGSGKSTQIQLLAARLKQENIPCYTTMEPTNSLIGTMIRQILTGRMTADNRVIAALFVADRLDHLLNDVDGIAAKVADGMIVLTDRYYFSSYAYHSIDMPMEWVIQANSQSQSILRPTVTVFVDVEPDAALERITKNRGRRELFEEKTRLVKVREKYLEAFDQLKDAEKVVIVDGNRAIDAVADDIWKKIKEYFA